MNVRDCYRILKVQQGAGLDEVKSAFRKQAFQLHPDLNPGQDAARKFRELNEAYVLLTRTLKQEPPKSGRTGKGPQGKTGPEPRADRAEAAGAYERQSRSGAGQRPGTDAGHKKPRNDSDTGRGAFHYKEEEVLSDLLKDPFARKVFEDIYQQIRTSQPARRPEKVSRRSIQLDWGGRKFNLDLSRGLKTRIKDWLRHQLDDEQTLTFPAHLLIPGRLIRIDVSSRFSKPKTIEVRLPSDFAIGKPIRLKGLGRQLGPYKGDLYLRIAAK
ncbi:J domain-containing protein [Paucidesulfovibrio longus]|uniref:J domain-containing protein n=1 Tax=Paucidesulfovibrio longus TaxID=889 RepID=UPI0003B64B94|nr:DnaJ domain-containing protein [Paucidesulfovibrio longus]